MVRTEASVRGAIGGYLGRPLRRWTTPFPALSFLRGSLKLGLGLQKQDYVKNQRRTNLGSRNRGIRHRPTEEKFVPHPGKPGMAGGKTVTAKPLPRLRSGRGASDGAQTVG